MSHLKEILVALLEVDAAVLALIVALAAIILAGVGLWAAVQLAKRRNY